MIVPWAATRVGRQRSEDEKKTSLAAVKNETFQAGIGKDDKGGTLTRCVCRDLILFA